MTDCVIRAMVDTDVDELDQAFCKQGWHARKQQLQLYLQEQKEGVRRVFVATWQGHVAGYLTLRPAAAAGPFQGEKIPEVSDFNVLQAYQRRGIGAMMMDTVEKAVAETCDRISLGVGLHAGYGTAQRMYVKRGYIPDGSGVWYRDARLQPYTACENDDDLVLYLSKRLKV
ncbi:MAG: GNAT family N-acetyltransferase [Clostridia bacterium]